MTRFPAARITALIVAATCVVSPRGAGQGTDAGTAAPALRDASDRPPPPVCDKLPATKDSVLATVYGSLAVQEYITSDGWKMRSPMAPENLGLALQEIAQRLIVPAPLHTPVFAVREMGGSAGDVAVPAVDGEFLFTLHADGTISHLRMVASTLAPQLDTSLVRALEGASAAHVLEALSSGSPGDTVPLRLTLGMSPDTGGAARTLFKIVLPALPLDEPAEARDHPMPVFPLVAWRNGIGGKVTVQFVVDERGHPMPGTFRLLNTDYREIALAALNTVSKWTYVAASASGCAIPQVERQEFTYKVRWTN